MVVCDGGNGGACCEEKLLETFGFERGCGKGWIGWSVEVLRGSL